VRREKEKRLSSTIKGGRGKGRRRPLKGDDMYRTGGKVSWGRNPGHCEKKPGNGREGGLSEKDREGEGSSLVW